MFWGHPSHCYLTDRMGRALAAKIGKDAEDYCNDCRHARAAPDWHMLVNKLEKRQLFCFPCMKFHPRVLFSQDQRRPLFNFRRTCIGRQGFLRLCAHRTVQWDELYSFAKRLSKAGQASTPEIDPFHCDHESHQASHHRVSAMDSKKCRSAMPSASLMAATPKV